MNSAIVINGRTYTVGMLAQALGICEPVSSISVRHLTGIGTLAMAMDFSEPNMDTPVSTLTVDRCGEVVPLARFYTDGVNGCSVLYDEVGKKLVRTELDFQEEDTVRSLYAAPDTETYYDETEHDEEQTNCELGLYDCSTCSINGACQRQDEQGGG